jgi:hypothetical protein
VGRKLKDVEALPAVVSDALLADELAASIDLEESE